jgi:hypothetical protein
MENKVVTYFEIKNLTKFLSILFFFFGFDLNAQCRDEISIDKSSYCILFYPDTLHFSSMHFDGTTYIIPKKNMLDYGAYIVFDKKQEHLFMCFFIDTNKQVSGMVTWFKKKRGKVHCIVANALADGTYNLETSSQGTFPMRLFTFSGERYEKINKQIINMYFLDK